MMTNKLSIKSVAVCLAGCLMAGCSANTAQYTNLSVSACVQSAKLAMRDADFTENLRVVRAEDGMIVYGEHGGYKGRVYCWADKRTVEVSGFDLDQTAFYRTSIIRRF
jgi:outer membrane murein-binding lipoprotein Lpp